MSPEKLKSIICFHCGYEIAAIYRLDSDSMEVVTPQPVSPRAAPSHPHLALIECPNCGKEMTTPMSMWLDD